MVKELPEWLESPVVTGVTVARNQIKFVVRRIPEDGNALAVIFQALAGADINIDMISTVTDEGLSYLSFTTIDAAAHAVVEAVVSCMNEFERGKTGWEIDKGTPVAKVSAVGDGMNATKGVASRAFSALRSANIKMLDISTSDINISVLVDESQADNAVETLAKEFDLKFD
ncbi:hypothetical protein FACS1894187_23580 [Synergistales bacterium]|nr:hypothetical protein FACS1894187_23580 [Synergistales bacterium]